MVPPFHETEKARKKKMSEASTATTPASTTPASTAPASTAPAPETGITAQAVKKPRSQAQLAALAKGRELRRSRRVVKDDDSAGQLLDRVKQSSSASAVEIHPRKRKNYDGRIDGPSFGGGVSNSTVIKVVGAAAVLGLAWMGKDRLGAAPVMQPTTTTSQTQTQVPPKGASKAAQPPSGASPLFTNSSNVLLSSGDYYP